MSTRRLAAAPLAILTLALAAAGHEAHGSAPLPWGTVVDRVDAQRPVVAITFDDGPHPVHTPRILDALRDQGVRATFFLVGRNVRRYPDLARRIVREGHAVGNHGDTHADLTGLSSRAARREIADAASAIRAATGERTWLFRPPYGAMDRRSRGPGGVVASERHLVVLWSIQVRDWDTSSPWSVAVGTLRRVRPGSIVLLHDGGGDRGHVVTATRWMIAHLTRRGYDLVTVPELLDAGS